MKRKIETSKAPKAIGTYSQAIVSGNNIYLSGQIPLDPDTMKIVEGEENQTTIPGRTRVPADTAEDKVLVVSKGASLGDIVNGLNAIGVTPRDLIAILQSIKASGALHAELVII